MTENTHCTLLRRLAAICYDLLLLMAVLFLAGVLAVAAAGGELAEGNPFFRLYLLLVVFLFFGWFWTHGGQTTGMRAWRVKVVTDTGARFTWANAVVRFLYAGISLTAFGIGFLWALFEPNHRTWHDKLSRTHLVVEPKPEKKK